MVSTSCWRRRFPVCLLTCRKEMRSFLATAGYKEIGQETRELQEALPGLTLPKFPQMPESCVLQRPSFDLLHCATQFLARGTLSTDEGGLGIAVSPLKRLGRYLGL